MKNLIKEGRELTESFTKKLNEASNDEIEVLELLQTVVENGITFTVNVNGHNVVFQPDGENLVYHGYVDWKDKGKFFSFSVDSEITGDAVVLTIKDRREGYSSNMKRIPFKMTQYVDNDIKKYVSIVKDYVIKYASVRFKTLKIK